MVLVVAFIVMSVFALWNEWERRDPVSLYVMIGILCGISGLILFDRSYAVHSVFAIIIIVLFFGWMAHHAQKYKDPILWTILGFELMIGIDLLLHLHLDILLPELLILAGFMINYLYLHFIES
jgi:hypothetical protein